MFVIAQVWTWSITCLNVDILVISGSFQGPLYTSKVPRTVVTESNSNKRNKGSPVRHGTAINVGATSSYPGLKTISDLNTYSHCVNTRNPIPSRFTLCDECFIGFACVSPLIDYCMKRCSEMSFLLISLDFPIVDSVLVGNLTAIANIAYLHRAARLCFTLFSLAKKQSADYSLRVRGVVSSWPLTQYGATRRHPQQQPFTR